MVRFSTRRTAARVLDSPLEQITLSFDGAKKETFEFYRKGAKFEKVRDNFVRFARMKHERRSRLQVVVQMVQMDGNAVGGGRFLAFWSAIPGVDQVRIKADETNLMRPDAGHAAADWKHPCHYLWRGAMYVKQNGDVYPCCQSYMLDGAPLGNLGKQPLLEIWNSDEMQRDAPPARHRTGRRNRYVLALLHHDSASRAGGRQPGAARQDGAPPASRGGAADVSLEAARPAAAAAATAQELGSGLRPFPFGDRHHRFS